MKRLIEEKLICSVDIPIPDGCNRCGFTWANEPEPAQTVAPSVRYKAMHHPSIEVSEDDIRKLEFKLFLETGQSCGIIEVVSDIHLPPTNDIFCLKL